METSVNDYDTEQIKYLNEFLNSWHEGHSITVKTSGSTGIPKNIQLTHEHLVRSAKRTVQFFNIKSSSRIHCAISFKYIGGKMMIARSLVSGCELTYSEPSLKPGLPNDNQRIKLLSIVPAQMSYILQNQHEFNQIDNFLLGGSAIDNRLWDKIVASGITAWESYGMTETASHIALRRIIGSSSNRPRFVAMKGIELKTDFENRIHIKDKELVVITNDIARMYADGSFEIIARKDDIIISGGLKIIPQQVETILQRYLYPFSTEFYLSSEPDEKWTSRLVLQCVPNPCLTREEPKSIIKKIIDVIRDIPQNILPNFQRPKDIRLIPFLPRNEAGKIIRR